MCLKPHHRPQTWPQELTRGGEKKQEENTRAAGRVSSIASRRRCLEEAIAAKKLNLNPFSLSTTNTAIPARGLPRRLRLPPQVVPGAIGPQRRLEKSSKAQKERDRSPLGSAAGIDRDQLLRGHHRPRGRDARQPGRAGSGRRRRPGGNQGSFTAESDRASKKARALPVVAAATSERSLALRSSWHGENNARQGAGRRIRRLLCQCQGVDASIKVVWRDEQAGHGRVHSRCVFFSLSLRRLSLFSPFDFLLRGLDKVAFLSNVAFCQKRERERPKKKKRKKSSFYPLSHSSFSLPKKTKTKKTQPPSSSPRSSSSTRSTPSSASAATRSTRR